MRFWQWAAGQFRFSQIPDYHPTGGGSTDTGPSAATRDRRQIVGGFAYQPPNYDPTGHGSLGSYGPGSAPSAPQFDPYRNGDQRRILGRLVNQGTISDLQLALVQAGLLDGDDVALGYLDSDTQDAFSTVLALANQNGMDWRDVLSQVAQSGGVGGNSGYGSGGSGGAQLAPTVIQLPNRDDVVAAAHDTAMSLTGVAADDDLAESIADHVLDSLRTQQERGVQRELSQAGTGPENVVFTEGNPDPARLIEEAVRERDPGGVAEKGARDVADLWFQDLAGPV